MNRLLQFMRVTRQLDESIAEIEEYSWHLMFLFC